MTLLLNALSGSDHFNLLERTGKYALGSCQSNRRGKKVRALPFGKACHGKSDRGKKAGKGGGF